MTKFNDALDEYFRVRGAYLEVGRHAAEIPPLIERLEAEASSVTLRLDELEVQLRSARQRIPVEAEEICKRFSSAHSSHASVTYDLKQAREKLALAERDKRSLAKQLVERAGAVGKLLHSDLAGVLGTELKKAASEPVEVVELVGGDAGGVGVEAAP